jgi:hypothetical protein
MKDYLVLCPYQCISPKMKSSIFLPQPYSIKIFESNIEFYLIFFNNVHNSQNLFLKINKISFQGFLSLGAKPSQKKTWPKKLLMYPQQFSISQAKKIQHNSQSIVAAKIVFLSRIDRRNSSCH